MKFEKLIKRAGISAAIVTDVNNNKWIYDDGVAMIIPPFVVDKYGDATATFPESIIDGLHSIDPDTTDPAELVRAEIPADGKAKEITRIYADADFEFDVSNPNWALIERYDTAYIAVDDDNNPVALAIYTGDRIVGIIFPIGFTIGDLEKID